MCVKGRDLPKGILKDEFFPLWRELIESRKEADDFFDKGNRKGAFLERRVRPGPNKPLHILDHMEVGEVILRGELERSL